MDIFSLWNRVEMSGIRGEHVEIIRDSAGLASGSPSDREQRLSLH